MVVVAAAVHGRMVPGRWLGASGGCGCAAGVCVRVSAGLRLYYALRARPPPPPAPPLTAAPLPAAFHELDVFVLYKALEVLEKSGLVSSTAAVVWSSSQRRCCLRRCGRQLRLRELLLLLALVLVQAVLIPGSSMDEAGVKFKER